MGLEQIDLDQIQDVEQAKRAIAMLFNLLEEMQTTVRQLQVENQRLRDENNRLKGEKGKPTIKPDKHAGKEAIIPRKPSGAKHKDGTKRASWRQSGLTASKC